MLFTTRFQPYCDIMQGQVLHRWVTSTQIDQERVCGLEDTCGFLI